MTLNNLKTLNDRTSNFSTSNSFSGASTNSLQSDTAQSDFMEAQFVNPGAQYIPNLDEPNLDEPVDTENSFYMYGDTSKSLIVNGLRETRHENLGEILLHCVNDIGIPLGPNDIENVHRIGKFDRTNKPPRPVKLVLKDQTKRDQILIFFI